MKAAISINLQSRINSSMRLTLLGIREAEKRDDVKADICRQAESSLNTDYFHKEFAPWKAVSAEWK